MRVISQPLGVQMKSSRIFACFWDCKIHHKVNVKGHRVFATKKSFLVTLDEHRPPIAARKRRESWKEQQKPFALNRIH